MVSLAGFKRVFCSTLLLVAGSVFLSNLSAQTTEIRLEEPDIQDAPPLATIDCMYEDSRGFLWLGCYSGLYMFDGYSMTAFYHNPNDSFTIGDNKIKQLLEDKHGNIWVGTQVGLNYYDIHKKIFIRYKDKAKYGLDDSTINDLKQDEAGNIWVAAGDGLYKKEPNSQRFKKYYHDPENEGPASSVGAIEITARGVYFCSLRGLSFLDFLTGKVTPVDSDKGLQTASTELFSLQQDRSGKIWIGTRNGLFYYRPFSDGKIMDCLFFKNEPVYFISKENDQGELWLGSQTGISILNTKTMECRKHIPIYINGEKMAPEQFLKVCNSVSGMVWMSSASRRLFKTDPRKLQFRHAPIHLIEDLHSKARNLFELYEYSPGVLLIPVKNGPVFLNICNNKVQPFPFRPFYNLSGWDSGIVCFLEQQDGKLWIGTAGGLFLFDKSKEQFVNLEAWIPAFSKLRGIAIRKIHLDRNNNLWIATWLRGVHKFDLNKHLYSTYYYSPEFVDNLISNTRSILETRNGEIWVGTRAGLLKYDESGDTFQVLKNVRDDPETMSENTGFCLYEDMDRNIWCGTYGGGLNKLDIRTGKFKYYTTSDGLLNNNVFSIMPDKKGNLWLLGYNGISKFNPANGHFQVFTQRNGLLSAEYDAFLYGKSRYSDDLFFCGKNGIDYFDPAVIHVSDYDPKVWITELKMFNESVPISRGNELQNGFHLTQDISFNSHLTLRYDQNVITLNYVALDFSSPQSVQYMYQLVGFDKDWQSVGNKRSVTFTNLDPGTYTFQVKASNGDGVWGSNRAVLIITILSPWWRTWWFLIFSFLSLSAIIIAFYQYRISQIRERESIRANLTQRIAEAKMEALRSQMNPHFIFNCLTSLKSYVEKNETEKASIHISKFSKLLRQVLDQAKSETIPLSEELDTLQRYVELEQMRYKNFDFQLEVQPDLPTQEISIPPLLIQPYIENAIWHGLQYKSGGKGVLRLLVEKQNDVCNITVEDNGIGRVASAEIKRKSLTVHQSHGLNLSAERVALFKLQFNNDARIEIHDLSNDDGKAAGTRIIMTFKI